MSFARTILAAAALLAAAIPRAGAIVGPSEPGGAYTDRVVMVLSRGREGSGFCTGVVLAPRVILTAAHCLRAPGDTLVLYRDDSGEPVTVPVAATVVHPRYRADAIARRVVSIDLGLLETDTPLPASFHPVVLADRAVEIGEPLLLAGFGVTREGEPKSGGAPRVAALRVRAPSSQVLLWADDPELSGGGACAGDSGGPILAARAGVVLALVAWTAGEDGRKCGRITQGPLIAPARAWIESVMARWGA